MAKRKAPNDYEVTEPKREALDVAIESTMRAKISTDNAEQSWLGRLPREVRDRIWQFAVGNRTLHINYKTQQWQYPPHATGDILTSEDFDDFLDIVNEDDEIASVAKFRNGGWELGLDHGCQHCARLLVTQDLYHCCHSVCQAPGSFAQGYDAVHKDPIADTQGFTKTAYIEGVCRGCSGLFDKISSGQPSGFLSRSRVPGPLESIDLRLLRSCRQVYNECNDALWTTNTFGFNDSVSYGRFMETRSNVQRQLLKSISLQMVNLWDQLISKELLSSFTGLRSVHILANCDYSCFEFPGQPISKLFEAALRHVTLTCRILKKPSEVKIIIVQGKDGTWSTAQCREYADLLEQKMLDPAGDET